MFDRYCGLAGEKGIRKYIFACKLERLALGQARKYGIQLLPAGVMHESSEGTYPLSSFAILNEERTAITIVPEKEFNDNYYLHVWK